MSFCLKIKTTKRLEIQFCDETYSILQGCGFNDKTKGLREGQEKSTKKYYSLWGLDAIFIVFGFFFFIISCKESQELLAKQSNDNGRSAQDSLLKWARFISPRAGWATGGCLLAYLSWFVACPKGGIFWKEL